MKKKILALVLCIGMSLGSVSSIYAEEEFVILEEEDSLDISGNVVQSSIDDVNSESEDITEISTEQSQELVSKEQMEITYEEESLEVSEDILENSDSPDTAAIDAGNVIESTFSVTIMKVEGGQVQFSEKMWVPEQEYIRDDSDDSIVDLRDFLPDTEINLDVVPEEGYELQDIIVSSESAADRKYEAHIIAHECVFVMPQENVQVTAVFTNTLLTADELESIDDSKDIIESNTDFEAMLAPQNGTSIINSNETNIESEVTEATEATEAIPDTGLTGASNKENWLTSIPNKLLVGESIQLDNMYSTEHLENSNTNVISTYGQFIDAMKPGVSKLTLKDEGGNVIGTKSIEVMDFSGAKTKIMAENTMVFDDSYGELFELPATKKMYACYDQFRIKSFIVSKNGRTVTMDTDYNIGVKTTSSNKAIHSGDSYLVAPRKTGTCVLTFKGSYNFSTKLTLNVKVKTYTPKIRSQATYKFNNHAIGAYSDCVSLVFTESGEVVGYEIYRSTSKNTGYKKVGTAKASGMVGHTYVIDTIYNDRNGIKANTLYYYKVRVKLANQSEYGPFSNIEAYWTAPARVDKAKIKYNSKVDFNDKNGNHTITWPSVKGATGYIINEHYLWWTGEYNIFLQRIYAESDEVRNVKTNTVMANIKKGLYGEDYEYWPRSINGIYPYAKHGNYYYMDGEQITKKLSDFYPKCKTEAGKVPSVSNNTSLVGYNTHVQTYGWQWYKFDGQMAGTSGQSKRLEGIHIVLQNQPYSGDIVYRTHVQTYGWQAWKKNGAMSGTSGESKRLEGIQIYLTGEMAKHYDVYYRVHAQTYGWLGYAKNGVMAGTSGLSKRLEGINIVLVPKGGKAPGSTAKPYVVGGGGKLPNNPYKG